jgi:carlactone synthase/all-trans-10'-apo-beta-carotenal 13,14-cleaving dioxygenase
MAAYHPNRPMLCTIPNAPFLFSTSSSGEIFHNVSMSKVGRIRCVKAGLDCGTKLCAWTNVQRERWEGDLAVEGKPPCLAGTYIYSLRYRTMSRFVYP